MTSPHGGFDRVDRGAAAFHHVLHAAAEDAVDADDHFVARLDEIDGDAFHARHAGAADGKGERVLRAENLAQHFAGLVHDGEILRIEVAERRRAERAQHALRHRAGAGAKKDAFGGEGGHFHGGEHRTLEYTAGILLASPVQDRMNRICRMNVFTLEKNSE